MLINSLKAYKKRDTLVPLRLNLIVPRNQTEEIHEELKNENEYIAEIKEDIKNQYSIEVSISKK